MEQTEQEKRDIGQILASRIAAERKKAGLTQAGLAEKLGYSDKSISKWERGDGIPDIFCLKHMADLFGITVDALLSHTDAMSAPIENADDTAVCSRADEPSVDEESVAQNDVSRTMSSVTNVNHWAIAVVTFVGIWLAGALVYLIGRFCAVDLSAILVAAWPISLLVMVIFNGLWGKHRWTFWFCTGFVIGILFFLCWVLRAFSIWKLMWLSIPATVIVWFGCKIRKG